GARRAGLGPAPAPAAATRPGDARHHRAAADERLMQRATPTLARARRARLVALVAVALASPLVAAAQDLTPRAYVVTPARSNAITLSYIFNDGELNFEGTVPIVDATGRLSIPALNLYRSFALFGRSANAAVTLPYGVGTFKGTVFDQEIVADRSGLGDAIGRLAVNLVGAPAMKLSE